MTQRQATGLQIVILMIAVLIVGEATDRYVFRQWAAAREHGIPVGRISTFLVAAAILFGVPSLRQRCVILLSVPVPRGGRKDAAIALLLMVTTAYACLGALALWWWSTGGEPSLARRMNEFLARDPWESALSTKGILTTFLLGGIFAPILEELIFRGFLYPAWESTRGWVASAFGTSIVFALIHPFVVPQFFVSLLLVSLFRKTGSLRVCIAVHALFNISLWHPFLGQLLLPAGRETGEISHWTTHLACLAVIIVAIPIYMWTARDANAVRPGALSPATPSF